MQTKNQEYFQYSSAKLLPAHKAHRIVDIKPIKHKEHDDGQMCFIKNHCGKGFKVMIPPKYLNSLAVPEDIDIFLSDIKKNEHPYFIFREEMANKSFRIDILPYSKYHHLLLKEIYCLIAKPHNQIILKPCIFITLCCNIKNI